MIRLQGESSEQNDRILIDYLADITIVFRAQTIKVEKPIAIIVFLFSRVRETKEDRERPDCRYSEAIPVEENLLNLRAFLIQYFNILHFSI